jgi:pilus assembly protein CpaF
MLKCPLVKKEELSMTNVNATVKNEMPPNKEINASTFSEKKNKREHSNGIEITKEDFGPFYKYVMNDDITDVDYDGNFLWVTDVSGNTWKAEENVSFSDIQILTQKVKTVTNSDLNRLKTILETSTENLRISIMHESIAKSGRSVCIRKTLPTIRMTPKSVIEQEYMPLEMLQFFRNCVKAKKTIVVCGEPACGKTEFVKFLTPWIPKEEKVITIEDTQEIRYKQINPGKQAVEIVVNDNFSYTDAIKASLRQNPSRLMLSEARSVEVKSLIEAWSTGICGYTTIHTDSVGNIPDRILDMMPTREDADRLENDIYRYCNVGVLVRKKVINGVKRRMIDQVAYFIRVRQRNYCHLLLMDGDKVTSNVPADISNEFLRDGIEDIFYNQEILEELGFPLDKQKNKAVKNQ